MLSALLFAVPSATIALVAAKAIRRFADLPTTIESTSRFLAEDLLANYASHVIGRAPAVDHWRRRSPDHPAFEYANQRLTLGEVRVRYSRTQWFHDAATYRIRVRYADGFAIKWRFRSDDPSGESLARVIDTLLYRPKT